KSAPMIAQALRDLNRTRHLIFLDQRGTGGSNALDCEFDEAAMEIAVDIEQTDRLLRDCHAELDAAVQHYTTGDAAEDLEALRLHLGLGPVNLIGGSYGTRMAQVYLRAYPEAVRSVVIDGVVPTRLRLGAEHAEKLDRSIEKLLRRCAEDSDCSARFPELEQAFVELKQRYAESSESIQVTNPRTGVADSIEFNADLLATSLRFLAYSPTSQMMIPYLIHEAATTGSPERLAAQAMITTDQLSEEIAIGLNFSVGCSEDWPYWPADHDATGTLMGNSFTELYGQVCSWWPSKPVGPEFHQPFDSDVPMLILSGELDPVTPPEYGEEAAAQFSNSLHLVGAGRGHIVMTQPCFGRVITEFVDEASVDELDTECIETLGPEPFFINLLGPSP
ncbi:MAG: hypothetical protein CVV18_08800, partial [Gammaproteobacteria bacterium HGW-Gammaproteobacteria-8]